VGSPRLCVWSHAIEPRAAYVKYMLDLNILGLYLRAVRSAKAQRATKAAGHETAVRRSSRARSAFEDDHHGPRRRTWRRAAATTNANSDADRLERVSEAETTNYLRRLTAEQRSPERQRGMARGAAQRAAA